MVKEKQNIAVGVCTRNRSQMLKRCIASLQACDRPGGADITIIVIDNSEDEAQRTTNKSVLAQLEHRYEVCLVIATATGISQARNRGLEEALAMGADALIFVDDDQFVPREWLEIMINVWREENCEAVKSSVKLEFEGSGKYREFFEETGGGKKECLPKRWDMEYTATNGVLISKRLFAERNLRFNLELNFVGGGDFDFFLQSLALGGRHVATSECWITETIPASKETKAWLLRRNFRVGMGQSIAVAPHLKKGRLYCIASALSKFPALLPQLLFAAIRGRGLAEVLKVANCSGQIWGACGLRWSEYRITVGN